MGGSLYFRWAAEKHLGLSKSGDRNIKIKVAEHPLTAIVTLEQLAQDKSIRNAVAKNHHLPKQLAFDLARIHNQYINDALFSNRNLDSEILEYLCEQTYGYDPNPAIREISICNSCCPSKYNNPWYCNPYDFRTSLLYDPALQGEDSADSGKIERFVKHPNTTVEILQKLKHSRYSAVRRTVASSPMLTEGMAYELAKDVSCEVREAISDNQLTPIELLDRLKCDRCSFVRQAVAANTHTSFATLRELLYDRSEAVVQKAMLNFNT